MEKYENFLGKFHFRDLPLKKKGETAGQASSVLVVSRAERVLIAHRLEIFSLSRATCIFVFLYFYVNDELLGGFSFWIFEVAVLLLSIEYDGIFTRVWQILGLIVNFRSICIILSCICFFLFSSDSQTKAFHE